MASVIASTFINDALDAIVDLAFYQTNRQHAVLIFNDEVPEIALEDVRRLPAVLQAEGQLFYPAILRNGHLEKRLGVEARKPDTDLARVLNTDGEVVTPSRGGILLSERLANYLNVQTGDMVDVAFLSGHRETHKLRVTGTVEQYFGLGAYMDLADMNTLFRQAPRLTTVNVTLDSAQLEDLHAEIKNLPALTGLVEMNKNREAFQDTIEENIVIMNTIHVTIAVLITVGVAYNAARIQLSERARELASLRILGFGRGEVSYILVGEIMLLALLAQPVGWLIGAWIAQAMTSAFSSDLYAIPLVLEPAMFARGSLVVLCTAFAAAMIVRRRLDRLDLVAVMKTRE